jgi:hypothetical protein
VLRQNSILEIFEHKSHCKSLENPSPRISNRSDTTTRGFWAHRRRHRKPPSRYDNIRRSQFLLSSDAFVAMMQSADFSDLNDPPGL